MFKLKIYVDIDVKREGVKAVNIRKEAGLDLKSSIKIYYSDKVDIDFTNEEVKENIILRNLFKNENVIDIGCYEYKISMNGHTVNNLAEILNKYRGDKIDIKNNFLDIYLGNSRTENIELFLKDLYLRVIPYEWIENRFINFSEYYDVEKLFITPLGISLNKYKDIKYDYDKLLEILNNKEKNPIDPEQMMVKRKYDFGIKFCTDTEINIKGIKASTLLQKHGLDGNSICIYLSKQNTLPLTIEDIMSDEVLTSIFSDINTFKECDAIISLNDFIDVNKVMDNIKPDVDRDGTYNYQIKGFNILDLMKSDKRENCIKQFYKILFTKDIAVLTSKRIELHRKDTIWNFIWDSDINGIDKYEVENIQYIAYKLYNKYSIYSYNKNTKDYKCEISPYNKRGENRNFIEGLESLLQNNRNSSDLYKLIGEAIYMEYKIN